MPLSVFGSAHFKNGHREPSLWRVMRGIVTILLMTVPCLLLGYWATEISSAPLRVATSVIGGIVCMVITGALGEWLVHRYLMHRPSRIPVLQLAYQLHHRAHHWGHFPPTCYVQSGTVEYPSLFSSESFALCGTVPARLLTITAYAVFYSVFAIPSLAVGWFLTSNIWFTAALAATAATLVFLFIRVHDAIHFPSVSRLERFRWFWFLDHHHYVHHIDNTANTNFLLPLGDLVMGTLRLELNEAERSRWPTYEEARRLPGKARVETDLMSSRLTDDALRNQLVD